MTREALALELAKADVDVDCVLIDGVEHRRVLRGTETYMTTMGPVKVERTLYKDRTDEHAKAVAVLEKRLGIIGGFWLPEAAKQAAWVVSQMTPALSEELFSRVSTMRPSKSSLDQMVTRGGGAAAGMGGGGIGSVMTPMGWASGGTKAMTGMYPDPFATGVGDMCRLYPRQKLGPCYANGPMMRKDISHGQEGLPMRLSFLVVRSDCSPVTNATVDIWHSGREGTYSALNSAICNPTAMSTVAETFCRGVQPTNEAGRADFDSIFPGWYLIRAIHIHFTVRIDGAAVTSQLYFEDELADDILSQGGYEVRGERPVRNGTDMEFRTGGATPEQVIFETAKRDDGALHAWKILSIG
jgi:protocatechuate 3,4-dioxygenase beta subunit